MTTPTLEQPLARDFDDLTVGAQQTRSYRLDAAVYQHFLDAFGDRNPMHVSQEAAQAAGFAGRVMHGAILNGFISHFVGMHFPGERSLLQSVSVEYRAPSYLGDELRIDATVDQRVESLRVVILKVMIHNVSQQVLAAKARVQVAIR